MGSVPDSDVNCGQPLADGLTAGGFKRADGALAYGGEAESGGGNGERKGELACYQKNATKGALELPPVTRGKCVVVLAMRTPGADAAAAAVTLADGASATSNGALIEKGPELKAGVELWKDKDLVAHSPVPPALGGSDLYRLCWYLSGKCSKTESEEGGERPCGETHPNLEALAAALATAEASGVSATMLATCRGRLEAATEARLSARQAADAKKAAEAAAGGK